MNPISTQQLEELHARKVALVMAIEKRRSNKWLLRLWGRFVKTRDAFRCVCCESQNKIQAHHIVRKTLYPWAYLDTGNGITLCSERGGPVSSDSLAAKIS
jgi:hypothetical protein